LLKNWRVANGYLLQLPDLTIWRIHIQVTIRFRFSNVALQAAQGAHVAIFTDDPVEESQVTTFNAFLNPLAKRYLMWDQIYTASTEVGGGIANVTVNTTDDKFLYKAYDIKSHRRLQNQEESLLMDITEIGTITIQEISFQQSTLLRLPR